MLVFGNGVRYCLGIMTLTEAKRFAIDHLKTSGYWAKGWRFEWMKRGCTRTLGQCSYRRKLLRMNPDYVRLCGDDSVKDTVIHEMAHIVAMDRFGERGHGRAWKVVCRQLGCDPKRLKNLANEPAWKAWHGEKRQKRFSDWALVDINTGYVFKRYRRKPNPQTIANAPFTWAVGRKAETLGNLRVREVQKSVIG